MIRALRDQLATRYEATLDPALLDRIEVLKAHLGGYETDAFGFDPEALKPVIPVVEFLYRKYFRVQTFGLENLPEGRVLLIANHSGQIPMDGMMIGTALLLDAQPPRAVRSMVERWVPSLPYVSVFFSRLGQVLGTPENCRTLLAQDHTVLVFPEGVTGINKTFDKRYQLQQFGLGFMRLALETGTPIVPVGVVGAEEQIPAIWNLKKIAKLLGMPALPVSPHMLIPLLGMLPLPTRYRLWFGHPMTFTGDADDDDAVIGAKVSQVRDAVDALLQRGLAEREHIFW
ncbi:MAG: lysophospholipid acyltransferase family protein [bacterium]